MRALLLFSRCYVLLEAACPAVSACGRLIQAFRLSSCLR